MTAVVQTLYKLGISAYEILENKEAAVRAVSIKSINYFFDVAVFVSGVEGQIYYLFAVLTATVAVVAAVLLGKLHARIEQRCCSGVIRDEIPSIGRCRCMRDRCYRVCCDTEHGEQRSAEHYQSFFHLFFRALQKSVPKFSLCTFSFAKNFCGNYAAEIFFSFLR